MVIIFDLTYRVVPCHLSESTAEQKEALHLGDCLNISVFYRLLMMELCIIQGGSEA